MSMINMGVHVRDTEFKCYEWRWQWMCKTLTKHVHMVYAYIFKYVYIRFNSCTSCVCVCARTHVYVLLLRQLLSSHLLQCSLWIWGRKTNVEKKEAFRDNDENKIAFFYSKYDLSQLKYMIHPQNKKFLNIFPKVLEHFCSWVINSNVYFPFKSTF